MFFCNIQILTNKLKYKILNKMQVAKYIFHEIIYSLFQYISCNYILLLTACTIKRHEQDFIKQVYDVFVPKEGIQLCVVC